MPILATLGDAVERKVSGFMVGAADPQVYFVANSIKEASSTLLAKKNRAKNDDRESSDGHCTRAPANQVDITVPTAPGPGTRARSTRARRLSKAQPAKCIAATKIKPWQDIIADHASRRQPDRSFPAEWSAGYGQPMRQKHFEAYMDVRDEQPHPLPRMRRTSAASRRIMRVWLESCGQAQVVSKYKLCRWKVRHCQERREMAVRDLFWRAAAGSGQSCQLERAMVSGSWLALRTAICRQCSFVP